MPDHAAPARSPWCLDVRGLTKRYAGAQGRLVLDGLSLQLARGEYVAVMGASGSGKSTLLNLLGGLLAPDSGSIHLEGQDLAQCDETARTLLRRRRIGFVFQAFHLLPHLDACDNVALPLRLEGCAEQPARQRAQALLERIGLGARSHALPAALSGGEIQRVAVARALVHRPALVLADEPTGNLDAATGAAVLALLRDELQASGGSGLLVTHAAEAAQTTRRTLILADGRLHAATSAPSAPGQTGSTA